MSSLSRVCSAGQRVPSASRRLGHGSPAPRLQEDQPHGDGRTDQPHGDGRAASPDVLALPSQSTTALAVGLCFKTVCVALLLRRLMGGLALMLEGGELWGSMVASISRSPTGSVASSVLQLDPLGSCSLLLLVKCWSFPFPQVSKFSGICLAAFGHAEILGTDHQIKRSEVFPACALEHSLCVHCSFEKHKGQLTLLTILSAKANQTI